MAASELSATKRARLAEEPTTVELSGGAAHPAEFVAFCCDHDDSFTDIVIRVEHKAFVAHMLHIEMCSQLRHRSCVST
jgi:hypothetical protein